MDLKLNKDILHKSCEEKISILEKQLEEMYKDNKDMFKKYKDSLTKYYISNEISVKLKKDLIEIEDKYNFIEKQLKNLIDEKKVWTDKDEHMTSFLHKNDFQKPEELEKFIIKYNSHRCLCNCPPIEENEKYKEQVMFVDILRYNEKERLRVEKENEGLRYDIDIGMKIKDKEIHNLNKKLLLIDNKNKLKKSNKYNEILFNNYIKEINNEYYYIENVKNTDDLELKKVDNIANVKLENPNEVILNNSNSDNISKDVNISILSNENEENKIKINDIKDENPSTSTVSFKNNTSSVKNILELCKVIAYDYDNKLYDNNKELQILEFISSENKMLI
jgi:hypothetical protein